MKLKNFFFIGLFLLTSQATFAQFSAGAGLSFGSEVEQLGIFARGQYDFTEQIRAALTINFFFPETEEVSVIETRSQVTTINADGHYIFLDQDPFKVYGLLGLNFAIANAEVSGPGFDEDDSESELGVNLGVGGQYFVNETFSPFAEIKYVIGEADQLVIMAGVLFYF